MEKIPTGNKIGSKEVMRLNDLKQTFTDMLDVLGAGFLTVSRYGVDIAVKRASLSPTLNEGGQLLWPDVGMKVDLENIDGIYAVISEDSGVHRIECDFNDYPQGFSLFFGKASELPLFQLVVETNVDKKVSTKGLEKMREDARSGYGECLTCQERAKKIKENTPIHPVCRMLERVKDQGLPVEFHVKSDYAEVVKSFVINESIYDDGTVILTGDDGVLRLDVSLIHGFHVNVEDLRGESCSVIRCYHSYRGVMIEMMVQGDEHVTEWMGICAEDHSLYNLTHIDKY